MTIVNSRLYSSSRGAISLKCNLVLCYQKYIMLVTTIFVTQYLHMGISLNFESDLLQMIFIYSFSLSPAAALTSYLNLLFEQANLFVNMAYFTALHIFSVKSNNRLSDLSFLT